MENLVEFTKELWLSINKIIKVDFYQGKGAYYT